MFQNIWLILRNNKLIKEKFKVNGFLSREYSDYVLCLLC
ncbi:hypothetical protein CBB_A0172 [Clostridium botulinum Bf]|nr:hypothetical protein CBB_A0172 [Clostridium botulinum Bf]